MEGAEMASKTKPTSEPTTCVRALTVPIFAAVRKGGDFAAKTDTEAGWAFLWDRLHAAWREGTMAANYTLQLLLANDTEGASYTEIEPPKAKERSGKIKGRPADKVPSTFAFRLGAYKPDHKAIYAAVRERFKLIDAQSVSSVIRKASSYYFEKRLAIHSGREAMRTFRYPQPLPVPSQNYRLAAREDGRLVIDVRVPVLRSPDAPAGKRRQPTVPERIECSLPFAIGDGAKKIELDYGRQLGPLRQVAAGLMSGGEATIRMDHRRRLLLTVPVHMPIPVRRPDAKRAMNVSTADDAFFVCEITGQGRPFRLNLDDIKHLSAVAEGWSRHLERVQRMGEDLKAEKRWTPNERKNIARRRKDLCERMHRRVSDALHKATRCVVDHAARKRCFAILYTDACMGHLGERFAYARLRELMRQKAKAEGIEFTYLKPADRQQEGDQPEDAA